MQAAQQSNPAYWVERGAALAEANCDAGTMKCVLDLLKSASWEKDPAKATVCVPTSKHDTKNKVCMNALYFAQGSVHAAVSNPQNPWLYYNYKQKTVLGSDKVYIAKVDPFPVRETAPEVFELIAQWGIYYDSDMQALNKYFKGVADPTTCGKKKNTCHEEMVALLGLAFLATQQDKVAKKDARKTITKILNKKWDSDDGGLVIKGAITGVWCVILTGQGKRSSFIFGVINVIFYAIISFEAKYYGEVMLNVLYYLPTNFIGWFVWTKYMNQQNGEVIKRKLSFKNSCLIYLITSIAIVGYGFILKKIGGHLPYMDSMTTVVSIVAQILLIKRLMEQWILWIAVDIITVVMWAVHFAQGGDTVATLAMWSVYLINACIMFWRWNKEVKKNEI